MKNGARHAALAFALPLALALGAVALAPSAPARAAPPGGFQHGHGPGMSQGGGDDEDQGHGKSEEHGKGHDKDHGKEHGKNDKHGKDADRHGFQDHDRIVVRDYFVRETERGHCPPGLAKKHNGCMPPGQAKRWAIGRPLPRDVVYYTLPPALVVQLTPPPIGYRYVRVASDILMIAAGTGLVAAAIEDLGR